MEYVASNKEGILKRIGIVLAAFALLGGIVPATIAAPRQQPDVSSTYVVVYAANVSLDTAHAAISAAGGTIIKENVGVGVATVSTSNPNFIAAVRQQPALYGVSRNASVGIAPQAARRQQDRREVEQLNQERQASKNQPAAARLQSARSRKLDAEPLADLQWDLQMIHATADGSYRKQLGSKRVLVGVIDTGIDGLHPDIAPNFDAALSRNFTQDIELVDGPCAEEPDQSCDDPADVDENGHGTHVAGTIGAALNGLGIAGIAPNVTLVNLRAGQDSGYFFLQSTVDALTYAGDIGVDVVNMSFYTDPWLYNCTSNPADSPEEQLEQRAIIEGTQRALRYAHNRGVTLVAAAGNEHTDIGHPASDSTSPDFPPETARTRTVDNSCLIMPTEGNNVVVVSAIGPSKAKADYSNYGVQQTDFAAPGGFFRDRFGTNQHRSVANLILSAYPESIAIANGDLNPDGTPNNDFVVEDCNASVCAYYQYLQGTSMAAPHAVGVAALIVSEYGKKDSRHSDGLTLSPNKVKRIMKDTATAQSCPTPRLVDYSAIGRTPDFNALCQGNKHFNGFYGYGIVDALHAVDD